MGSWQIEICNTYTVKYDIKSTVPCSSHGSNSVGGGGSLRSQRETQAGYFRSRSEEQSISLLLLVNQWGGWIDVVSSALTNPGAQWDDCSTSGQEVQGQRRFKDSKFKGSKF